MKKLLKLQIEGNDIDDAGLARLVGLDQLQELWAGRSLGGVTDSGLEHISKLTNLRKLSLSDSAITAKGLEKLVSLSHLVSLDIDNTSIGDEAIPTLARLKTLNGLSVIGTRMTLKGVLQLRTMLPKCDVQR